MNLELYRYTLPLREPVSLRDVKCTERSGLLLHDPATNRWSDASPLPGFSQEQLSDVISAASIQQWNRYPSLEFAFSALAIELPQAPVPINALLMGDEEAVLEQAAKIAESKFTTVKLKVGREANVQDEVRFVRRVRKLLHKTQRLRLDANRSWNKADASLFAKGVTDQDIEYLEEPCECPGDFEEVLERSGLPYALDETLHDPDYSLADFPNAATYVLKPTLLGQTKVEQLLSTETRCVFSSSFESGVGVLKIAAMAERNGEEPAGLDTYRYLASDVLSHPISVEDGNLIPPTDLAINMDLLTKVPLADAE